MNSRQYDCGIGGVVQEVVSLDRRSRVKVEVEVDVEVEGRRDTLSKPLRRARETDGWMDGWSVAIWAASGGRLTATKIDMGMKLDVVPVWGGLRNEAGCTVVVVAGVLGRLTSELRETRRVRRFVCSASAQCS